MNAIWQDLRFGVRILGRHRQFSGAAVLLLALGIGATTAVFSVVNAVLLRPLPYVEPSRLVAVTGLYKSNGAERRMPVIALSDMAEWRKRSRTIASMGAFAYTQLPVRIGDRSIVPVTALMDPQFLPTLGNSLALGTFFSEHSEDGGDLTAIVSHALWVEAFGKDPSVIGRPFVIDGTPYVVWGVLAPDFQFPRSDASYFTRPVELLIPASSFPNFPGESRQWFGIARLREGVGLAEAQSEIQAIAEGLSREAQTTGIWSVQLTSLAEETTRKARQPLLIVLGISGVLLLIAATNLMNLFFSWGVARLREMSIRRAIGSTTTRLVRQLLTEALILAAAGGTLGVLLAVFAVDALVRVSPIHLPVTHGINIDTVVLAFTTAVCVAAALMSGFFPALHVGVKADEALRTPGMRVSAGRTVTRVQHALCVAQIGLGMALLAAAGLLSHSLWRLNSVEPGYERRHVLGFNLSVPNDHPMDARIRFYASALDEIRSIPGVERAGLISFLPPEIRAGVFMGLAIDGLPPPGPGAQPRVINTLISSIDYFDTMRIPVLAGRDFDKTDTAASRPVIMVNQALVKRYFPRGDAIGRRIGTGFDGMKPRREIIGIVKDTHDRGLASEPYPTVYIPFTQFALPYGSIALRARVAPDSLTPVIRDRLNRLNPSVPLSDFQTLDMRLHESLREPRFYTMMAATSASLAVLFVTFGLYGLLSYAVSRRTSELGIRMAVGANSGAILRLVLWQGLRMTGAGVALGLGLSVIFTRGLRSLLFEVQPLDPLTISAAATAVVAITLAASLAPARRASRVDPITALRHE